MTSLYIRNLPSGTRYWEVKSFLRNNCGISTFNANSLEPDKAGRNCSMKVTVDLDDAEDKNKLMRQISNTFKGQYLIVEEIGNSNMASNTFSSFNNPTTNYKNSSNSNLGNSNFDQYNYNNQGPNNRNKDNVNTTGYKTLLGDRSGNQGGYQENTSGYGYNRNQNMDSINYDTTSTSQPSNQGAYDNRPMSILKRPAPNKSILANKSYNRTGFNQDSGSFNNAGYQNQKTGYGNQVTTNQTQLPSSGQFQRNKPDRQTNIPSLFNAPRPNIAPFGGNTRSDRTYHDQAESNWDRNEPQFSQNEGYRSSDPTVVGHGQFSEPPRNIPQTDYYNQPMKSLLKNTFQSRQQGYNTTGFSQPHMGGCNDQVAVAPRQPLYGKKNDSLRSKLGDNSPQRSSRWDSGPEVFERALERYDSEDMYPDNQTQIQRGNNKFSTKRKPSPPPLMRYDYTAKNDQPKRSFEKRPFYEINEYTENRQSSGSMGNKRSRSSGSLDSNMGLKERKRKRPRNRRNKSDANQSSSVGPPLKKSAPTVKPTTSKPERFTRPNVERQPPNKSFGNNKVSPLQKSAYIGKPETYGRANIERQPPNKSAGNNKVLPLPKSTNIGEPAIFGLPNVAPPCQSIGTKEGLPFVKPTNISEAPKQTVANKTGNFQIMEGISQAKLNNPQVVELLEKANQGLLNTTSYIDFGRDKGVRINAANFIAKEILKEMGFNVQNKINTPKIKKLVEVILVRFNKLFGNTLQVKGKAVMGAYKNAYDGEDIAAFMNKAFNARADEFIDFVGARDKNDDKPKSTTGDDWFDLSTAARKEAVNKEITELTDLFRQELKNHEGLPDRVMENDTVFNTTVDAFSQVMKHQLEHRLQREVHNFYLKLYVYSGKLLDKAEVMKTLSQHGVIHLLKAEREKMFVAQVDTLENYDKLFQMEMITVGGKPLRIEPMYFRVPMKSGIRSGPREQPPPKIIYHNHHSEITKTVGTKVPEVSSEQKEVIVEKVNVTTIPKDTNKTKVTNEKANVTTVPKDEEVSYKKVNLDDSDIQVKDKTVVCVDLTDDLMMESDDFVMDSFDDAMQFDDDTVQQKLVSADGKNDDKNDETLTEGKNDETVTKSKNETEKSEITKNVKKKWATQSGDDTPQSLPANDGVKRYANQLERKRAKMQRRAERKRLNAQMRQNQEAREKTKKVDEDQTRTDAVVILNDDEMGPGSEERHNVEPLCFSDDELEDY